MAFGAKNVQAAERDNLVVLGFALVGKLVVDRFPLIRRNLEDFSFVLEEHHGSGSLRAIAAGAVRANYGGSSGVRHRELVLQKIFTGEKLRIAAEQNVRAATSHVGCDGDRAFATGLRDDTRFTLVLLCVEHLVRNASLLENLGYSFRFF